MDIEEIQNNEYIRTKNGRIAKVINNQYYMQQYIETDNGTVLRENIVKHSKNIIDLVEKRRLCNNKCLWNRDI